jgi:hypothetical protein
MIRRSDDDHRWVITWGGREYGDLVTLAEASADHGRPIHGSRRPHGVVGVNLADLEKARRADPSFPAARLLGDDSPEFFPPHELERWEQERPGPARRVGRRLLLAARPQRESPYAESYLDAAAEHGWGPETFLSNRLAPHAGRPWDRMLVRLARRGRGPDGIKRLFTRAFYARQVKRYDRFAAERDRLQATLDRRVSQRSVIPELWSSNCEGWFYLRPEDHSRLWRDPPEWFWGPQDEARRALEGSEADEARELALLDGWARAVFPERAAEASQFVGALADAVDDLESDNPPPLERVRSGLAERLDALRRPPEPPQWPPGPELGL